MLDLRCTSWTPSQVSPVCVWSLLQELGVLLLQPETMEHVWVWHFQGEMSPFHACATELICSSDMETSVISRADAGDWIPHLTGADTQQKSGRNVKILVPFYFFFPEENPNYSTQTVAETRAERLWPLLCSQSAAHFCCDPGNREPYSFP